MTKPVIFDIDGTLLDSVNLHAQAWHVALGDFGIHPAVEEVRSQIGKGGDQLLPVFLSKDQIDDFGEKLTEHRSKIWKERFMHKVRPFPCVPELFQAIAERGRKLALASSAKGNELETYKKLLGIEKFVDEQTLSDDAEKSKPHPDIFQAALDKLGTRDAIVIGDSPYDAIAGCRIGLECIGVLCGGFERQSLIDAGCTAIYADPAALLSNFNDWLLSCDRRR